MKGTQYTQLMDPYATENAGLSPISSSNYNIGAQVNSCIPAGWWDFLYNNLVTRARQSYNDINVLYTEILNVLSAAGVTPSEADSTQLAQSLKTLFNAVPIATHNAVGKVKSSSGKGNVSVDSQTGIMTANGVGAMSDSTSGINANLTRADIISALAYLSRSMGGHQIAIPIKPENWQVVDDGYLYYPSSVESNPSTAGIDGGVAVSGDNKCLAVRGGARWFSSSMTNPGWYRIVIWGGVGGKGGNSGDLGGYVTGSSIGGSITGYWDPSEYPYAYTTGHKYAPVSGGPGGGVAIGYIDLYLPLANTEISGLLGGGGNAGASGGYVNSSGDYVGSTIASGGAAVATSVKQYELIPPSSSAWVTRDIYTGIASRLPSFIKGTAGSSGSTRTSGTFGDSTSGASATCQWYCGGGGGGGSNGGGTFIRVGNVPLYCCGTSGGYGGSHEQFRTSSRLVSTNDYWNVYIPASTGGDGASNYEGSIRTPLAAALGFSKLMTHHPGLWDGSETGNYVFRTVPYEYISPCMKAGSITISGSTATIDAGGATTTFSVPSGTSLTDGFPGGIVIFRGANI